MAKRSRFSNGMVIANGRPTATNPAVETVVLAVTRYTTTINPASVGAATSVEQTFTVTGLLAGDIVLAVNKPTATTGLGIVNARVSAADTLAITFMNATAGAVDAASESYEVVVGRFATS
jgi:hypothetical protein